jgi:hypothetical protein
MLKKLLALGAVAFVVKKVLDQMSGNKDADLWAEATDTVEPKR